MKDKIKLRDLCREVGVSHLEVVEVLRRVRDNVIDDDAEVITQTVGTFYASKHKARTRTLNGIVYNVPAKVVVALRGPRFPGTELTSGVRLGDIRVSIDQVESVGEGGLAIVVYKRINDFAALRLTVDGQIPNGEYTTEEFEDFPSGSMTLEIVELSDRNVFGTVTQRNQTDVLIALPLSEPKKLGFGTSETMLGVIAYSDSSPGQGEPPVTLGFTASVSRDIDTFGSDLLISV